MKHPGNIHRDKMQYNVPPVYGLQQQQTPPMGYPSPGYGLYAPGGNSQLPAGIVQPQAGQLLMHPPGIHGCCFHYFIRNSLVALLEALFAQTCKNCDSCCYALQL